MEEFLQWAFAGAVVRPPRGRCGNRLPVVVKEAFLRHGQIENRLFGHLLVFGIAAYVGFFAMIFVGPFGASDMETGHKVYNFLFFGRFSDVEWF